MTTIAMRGTPQGVPYGTVGTGTHTVTIPSSTQAGDTIFLQFAGGGTPDSTPAGFSAVRSGTANNVSQYVYSRIAQSGDGGTTVSVTSAGTAKQCLNCITYQGTSTSAPIDVSNVALETGGNNGFVHPAASVTSTQTEWIVRFFANRDVGVTSTGFVGPASVVNRQVTSTGGTSGINAVVADTNADVGAGTYAGNWTTSPATGAGTDSAIGIAIGVAPVSTTTVVRPIADITSGSTSTAPSAQTLFSVTADDDPTTYVESAAGGTTFEVKLGSLSTAPNVISVKGYAAGGAVSQSVTTYLVENTTIRATFGPETTLATSETEYRYTLSGGQKSSISDNTNLRVRITSVMA